MTMITVAATRVLRDNEHPTDCPTKRLMDSFGPDTLTSGMLSLGGEIALGGSHAKDIARVWTLF